MRGGEKCLEVFCELFPDADLHTLLHVKGAVSASIEKHSIRTSFIQHLPYSKRYYRYYLPFFPKAVETFDLSGYDLVFSSSHCVAKGVKTSAKTCHISYIHTPMRYIWDQYENYFSNGRSSWLSRQVMTLMLPHLRRWDVASGQLPNHLIASSAHVANRIQNHYHRAAIVIHPPVDTSFFEPSTKDEGYYLMVTAFAPYKRVDLAITAFNHLGWPLRIIGSGQEARSLKAMARSNIEFLGWQPAGVAREQYAGCKAVIFPGEEDFGIVPLEAMATGKPVVAYGKGGVLETIIPANQAGREDHPTGVFFFEQNSESLQEALRFFEKRRDLFDAQKIRRHSLKFDRSIFKERIRELISEKYDEFLKNRPC